MNLTHFREKWLLFYRTKPLLYAACLLGLYPHTLTDSPTQGTSSVYQKTQAYLIIPNVPESLLILSPPQAKHPHFFQHLKMLDSERNKNQA